MPRTAQDLIALIEQGETDKCVAFLKGASETERQSLADLSSKILKEYSKFESDLDQQAQEVKRAKEECARVAVFATCSLSTLKSLGWRIHPIDDVTVEILADRKPKWLAEFAEYLLDGERISWMSVRKLMRAGLISKPKHDNYVLGMTHLFTGVGGRSARPTSHPEETWTLLTHLETEPDLLPDVWRLFEIEGSGEYSLAAHDKYSHESRRWDYALSELSRRGALPRDRLLDASLAALERGFAQFRAGWFSAFHEFLRPTPDERVVRLDQYLRLLASPIPPTVTFALTALELIDKSHPIAGEAAIAGLRPTLSSRAKGCAKSGLKFLERIARREPDLSPAVARIAADALIHEASELQSAAIELIAFAGDPADATLVNSVTAARDAVAPSVKKAVSEWLDSTTSTSQPNQAKSAKASAAGKSSSEKPSGTKSRKSRSPVSVDSSSLRPASDSPSRETAKFDVLRNRIAALPPAWRKLAGLDESLSALEAGQLSLRAIEFDGTEIPRLDATRRITPIATVDELIDVAANLIENPGDVDQIERWYDGVSRFCDQRPDDLEQRTGPLLKRVRTMMKRHWIIPFTGQDPALDVFGVVLAWLTGDYGTFKATTRHGQTQYDWEDVTHSFPKSNMKMIRESLAARTRQLSDRVILRKAVTTLCAPTHSGGWVDPAVLVERVNDKQILGNATDMEKVLALLRLAPDGRSLALSKLANSKDEFVAALKYALGADLKKAGPTAWLWVAAARSRHPFADDGLVEHAHPKLGPDAGIAAHGVPGVKHEKYEQYNYVLFHLDVTPARAKGAIDSRLLTVRLWKFADAREESDFGSPAGVAGLFQIWPLAQEAACAAGAVALASNLDWPEAQWQNRGYLQPLLDPDLPLKPMALLLLVLGLAAKEPGEQGLATDVAIAAIHDGRLDGAKLGAGLTQLIATGLIKAARWAKSLENVSRVSPLHAEVVRDAVVRCLHGDPAAMPKDLHALVEVLKELVVESQSAVDGPAREFLEQLSGSGKLAKSAKSILAAKPVANVERIQSIQRRAVEIGLDRAERWSRQAQ